MTDIDKPVDVRKGEELDTKKVAEFLKDNIAGLEGDVSILQFPSGHSNLTYSVKIGERELVLRKPPAGKKAKTAHDMSREYKILTALKNAFPYVPETFVYNDDPSIIGTSFYVMERLNGLILRKDLPGDFLLSKDGVTKFCHKFVDVFCNLHAIDYKAVGLEDFGKPEGYVKRQVKGWSRRYRDAKTDDAPDFEKVMEWLHEKMPLDIYSPAIIHNDYKFDNVVLNPSNPVEITGVLDWEMATLGDPLMDLGGTLAYWIDHDDSEEQQLIRMLPTNAPGMFTRKELIECYVEKTGRQIEVIDFYYCFGLFKLAVIAQQIYFRYYHGQTKDERFRMFIFAVQILEKTALKVIEQSDL
ncbi:MAG: phosphotransferase family protein [Deltaproteobacteria bacterium]|nr:phosphotransferase family protein [Deltaproteobacteria bacterium]